MPSVLRGCFRVPPPAPRAGRGVRPLAAGADAVRGSRSAVRFTGTRASRCRADAKPGSQPAARAAASTAAARPMPDGISRRVMPAHPERPPRPRRCRAGPEVCRPTSMSSPRTSGRPGRAGGRRRPPGRRGRVRRRRRDRGLQRTNGVGTPTGATPRTITPEVSSGAVTARAPPAAHGGRARHERNTRPGAFRTPPLALGRAPPAPTSSGVHSPTRRASSGERSVPLRCGAGRVLERCYPARIHSAGLIIRKRPSGARS